jgi:phage terminase large subunit
MASRLAWVVLRTRVSMTRGQGLITTTPHNMGWLYTEYYIPWRDKLDDALSFFTWKSIENPHFDKKHYNAEKRRLRPEEFARRYEGKFEKMEGLVYDIPEEQIIEFEDIMKRAEARIMSIDWGFRSPAAIGIYYLYDKAWYVVDEWKRAEKTTAEIIEIAIKIKAEHRIQFIYADPAEPDRIEECRRAKLDVEEALKDVKGGISYIQQLIREKKFFIFNNCHDHIDEINTYSYPEEKEGKEIKDVPMKFNDHLMDAMRYGIFTYPKEGTFKMPSGTEGLKPYYPGIDG